MSGSKTKISFTSILFNCYESLQHHHWDIATSVFLNVKCPLFKLQNATDSALHVQCSFPGRCNVTDKIQLPALVCTVCTVCLYRCRQVVGGHLYSSVQPVQGVTGGRLTPEPLARWSPRASIYTCTFNLYRSWHARWPHFLSSQQPVSLSKGGDRWWVVTRQGGTPHHLSWPVTIN